MLNLTYWQIIQILAPTDFNPRLIVVFVQLQIFSTAHEYLQRKPALGKMYRYKTNSDAHLNFFMHCKRYFLLKSFWEAAYIEPWITYNFLKNFVTPVELGVTVEVRSLGTDLSMASINQWQGTGTLVMLLVPLCSDGGRQRRRGKGWTPLAASPACISIRFCELGPT